MPVDGHRTGSEQYAAQASEVWTGQGVGYLWQIRPAEKLRLSLVASCNFACFFCHNEGMIPEMGTSSDARFSPSDYQYFGGIAGTAGIRTIYLTGGEPLLYRHGSSRVHDVVESIVSDPSTPSDVSLTTNGQLLSKYAERLRKAGLKRTTVSMHALSRESFRRDMGGAGSPVAQLKGIEAAISVGLKVKVNTLVYRENLGEIEQLVIKLRALGVRQIRLYRLLWSPLSGNRYPRSVVSDKEIVELAARLTDTVPNKIVDKGMELLQRSAADSRSIAIGTSDFSCIVDAMPMSGTWEGTQEGDYALRLSATGGLHSRLFGDEHDIGRLLETRQSDALMEVLLRSRTELGSK